MSGTKLFVSLYILFKCVSIFSSGTMDLTFLANPKFKDMETTRCKSCGTTMAFPTKRCMLVYRYCTYCALETTVADYTTESDEGVYIQAKADDPNSGGGRKSGLSPHSVVGQDGVGRVGLR